MQSAEHWFVERLESLPQSPEVKAYAVGVLNKFARSANGDMSTQSMVLAFADAKWSGNFEQFQRLGDWALWTTSFSTVTDDIVLMLGRNSYDACYHILRQQCKVYQDLSRNLTSLAIDIKQRCFLIVP